VLYYPHRDKNIRFYLGAEVECLGSVRHARRQTARKIEALNIKLLRIHHVLRAFVVGDYLRHPNQPSTTLDEIQQRFAVLDRVKRIRRTERSAHPGALFDFCIQYPKGTAEDFRVLKGKAQMVFRLLGDNIMRRLTKTERESLLETPLKDVVEEFNRRDKKASVRYHLERRVSSEMAARIVTDKACQARIDREDDEMQIGQKLLKFWTERSDKDARRKVLDRTASKKGLESLMSCLPKKMYMYGFLDCDPEEIVGICQICNGGFFPILEDQRLERVSIAVTKFEECLYSKEMTHDASVAEAVRFAKRVPLPEDNASESFDYHQLATGFWSQLWYKL